MGTKGDQMVRQSDEIMLLRMTIYTSILTLFFPPISLHFGGSSLTIYIGEAFILLSTLLWLIKVLAQKQFEVIHFTKYLFIFLLLSLLSTINVHDFGRYLQTFLAYLEVLFILLLFSNLHFDQKQQTRAINFYIYAGLFLAFSVILKTLVINGGDFIIGQKIQLSIGGSNYLATNMMIPFFILFTSLFNSDSVKKMIKTLFFLLVFSVAIVYTGSRTALIFLLFFIVVFSIKELFWAKKRTVNKGTSFALFALFMGSFYLLGNEFIGQMISEGRFENLLHQSNLMERFAIFGEYFDAFLLHPFVGNGFSNVNALHQYYLAHNFILQLLGDTGLVATVVFLTFMTSIFLYLRRNVRLDSNPALATFIVGYKRGLIVVLCEGMLEPNFGTKLFMLYLFMGLGIVIASNTAERLQHEHGDEHL